MMSGSMNYSSLTNKELLRFIDDKRSDSPIIKELCDRLEQLMDTIDDIEKLPGDHETKSTCPVCDAKITIATTIDLNKESHVYGLGYELKRTKA